MRNRIGSTTRAGHRAHTRMGLPRGNPLAGGGNFRGGRSSGGRGRRRVGVRTRRGY
jgi:hypothetical protein